MDSKTTEVESGPSSSKPSELSNVVRISIVTSQKDSRANPLSPYSVLGSIVKRVMLQLMIPSAYQLEHQACCSSLLLDPFVPFKLPFAPLVPLAPLILFSSFVPFVIYGLFVYNPTSRAFNWIACIH